MGFISSSFTAPGVTNDIIAVIYKTTAPSTEVARLVNAGNALNPWNFVFTDLPDGTYIVRIHDSPDGTTLGNIRHDYWINAVTNQVERERIWITVGGPNANDPADGDTSVDLGLPGRVVTGVFKEGWRYFKPTECDYTDQSNIELLLDVNGNQFVFSQEEVYVIELAALVATATPTTGGGMDSIVIQNGNELTINITNGVNDLNKTHLISSTNNSQQTILPAVASVSDDNGYKFVHDGGSLVNVDIETTGSDLIRFRGADVDHIYLGKGEWVKLLAKSGKWYVVDYHGQWDYVGRRINVDAVGNNMLTLNGTKYDGAVYKRLYEFALSLPPSQKVTEGVWLTTQDTFNGVSKFTKRSLYMVDTVNQELRVPDDLGKSYRNLLNIGGSDSTRVDNVAGGYQPWQVGPHDHSLPIDGVPPAGNRQSLTSTPNNDERLDEDNRTGLNIATENRVENVGQIPVVLI
ncbi:receptor-binding domain of short tail fiber protein [Pseudanabaena phage Pan5]|nr:receptor-binding domain of short tail fiber protein [Pseudanabaena phage Pan5]